MADMLLDTTLFNDYRAGDAGARAVIEQIVQGKTKASVSSVTVLKLWSEPNLDRRIEMGYASMLNFLEDAPLTSEAAKVAGLWLGALPDDERQELAPYAIMAAIAQERMEPICTRNTEPFKRFYSQFTTY